jgi:hypothetical protein
MGPQRCWLCRLPSIDVKGKGVMRTWFFPTDVDIPSIKAGLIQNLADLADSD